MKSSHIRRILKFYDEKGEFKKNERYSDSMQTVYTRPEDKFHWLVVKPTGENTLEIHLTDEQGRITARDTYESKGRSLQCVDMERLSSDGKHRMHFNTDEVRLIEAHGDENVDRMHATFSKMQSVTKDALSKEAIRQTAEKVSHLKPEVCSVLVSCIRNRKLFEQERSIREKLIRAKEQSKQKVSTAVPKREKSQSGKEMNR